ncbi:glycerol kinase GlpK [Limnoglobus roseus]|uniref:Glycerol kinase n=1 Tax=Limnoglobus roseus TaxID=2598579 RepID=A0A5C1A907_9BACT|nr:glycerol kinase GlpK [Limnoglobus roseus]QEL15190.1 glycerol kinase [Limnoglobus roseus]
MKYTLSLDEGTTSARAIVFNDEGSVVAVAQKEFEQHFPKPGWVEHDADEIWAAQIGVAVEALSRARIAAKDVAAVGIANQRETTVIWDRTTGTPIGPAIVWQDRRTAGLCDRLRADGHEALIQQRTGLLIDAYFSGSKVAWMLDNVPGARAKAEAGQLAFGTIDSWLAWKLTGGKLHVTDISNASRTMLFNIHTGCWDDDLLKLLNVPPSLLPEVRASSEVYGDITAGGLAGVPLAGIAGDQQAALFGQMCFEPGLTKNTYGTGCFMLQNTGPTAVASRNRLLTTVGWKIGDVTSYAMEGAVFVGGAVVQWLRDGLKIIRSAEEVNALAATVPDNGGLYIVPAFTGLGAPHWDPYARGTIVGITRGTTAGHLARAALESIAFQSAELLTAMRADAGQPPVEMRVDGGACRSDLLMQCQADLLGIPVARPEVTETTALGAAYLAGLAVGVWKTTGELAKQYRVERRFEPQVPADRVAAMAAEWSKAVERAKNWATP